LLFEHGAFCEFAVFEQTGLQAAHFSRGRFAWRRPDTYDILNQPSIMPEQSALRSKELLVGEIITNLYVGMGRDRRGDKLSVARFIQSNVVDRLLELADYIETEQDASRDFFTSERRFEKRHPGVVIEHPGWMQGYTKNHESVPEILGVLERHFEVNNTIAKAIGTLGDMDAVAQPRSNF
jgi:lincosamide nucleotidyltransferase B/F